ncbi:MAG: DUF4783 domain-containing protein [Bacteroidota bacterium]
MMRFIFLTALLPLLAFNSADSLSDISRAMSSGSASTIGQYFDDNVEIALMKEEKVYNKAQAISKLDQFFSQHRPKSFSQVHEGSSKGNASKYCIGNLQTSDDDFRVYMFISVENNHFKIQELRIE